MHDRIKIVFHESFLNHDTSGDKYHPETPRRLVATMEYLRSSRLSEYIEYIPSIPASREWLLKVHSNEYLLRLEEACLSGKEYICHPDNRISYASYEASLYSCGAGLKAVDEIENGGSGIYFCLVRPPGHHAEKSLALGFCLINNAAVCAKYWQERYGRERIVIFDFDAHHGNGIEAVFEEDPTVYYISIHEHPTFSFPGTGYADDDGRGAGKGTTLNLPLKPGTGDEYTLELFDKRVMAEIEAFRPDAIIVAAGFDGHMDDDMSGLGFSTRFYAELGIRLSYVAKRFCNGRIVSILEGGYNLEVLPKCIEAYLFGLSLK